MRRRPSYFERDNPGILCEPYEVLCDAFVLCHHPVEDWEVSDHREPSQWICFIVPARPELSAYRVQEKPEGQRNDPSYDVVPASLRKGIRGRPACPPLSYEDLTEEAVRQTLSPFSE